MDESTRLRMRRGHLKHKGYCTCGKVVAGNGAKASHRKMHERIGDGHFYLVPDEWEKRMQKAKALGLDANAIARVGL